MCERVNNGMMPKSMAMTMAMAMTDPIGLDRLRHMGDDGRLCVRGSMGWPRFACAGKGPDRECG